MKIRSTDPAILDARKRLKTLRNNLIDARRNYRREKLERELLFADEMRKLRAEYEEIYKSLNIAIEEIKPFAASRRRRRRI